MLYGSFGPGFIHSPHRAVIQGKWLCRVSCIPPLDFSNHIKTKSKNADKSSENTTLFSVCQSPHPGLLLKFLIYEIYFNLYTFCNLRRVTRIFIVSLNGPLFAYPLRNTIREYTHVCTPQSSRHAETRAKR